MAANDAAQRTVKIDVVSDTVCPWCYVGKARLQKAISSFQSKPEGKGVRFEVNWHPFQLNPGAPADDPGKPKLEVYYSKFGKERVEAMLPQMAATFQQEGLPPYSMEGKTGSTLNSHRLISWAGKAHGVEAQNRLVDKLFESYFTQAKYINDRSVLLDAAVGAGLPEKEAAAVIDDPTAVLDEVEGELRRAYASGISGVPNFSIGRQQLSGAQDPSVLERALAAAAAA
eukprot:CAMPEP_0206140286 /NCGR_PEP_ID=MMETSP1473-20131121/8908_1 /ASSEMBLY_ACC=CAM_ASM_001109 /TAXON_ID=1461547 /ORGANISM="Stichococcus sp, Strain RCC1054" /LENGTH=227 /DNA_ID=CAMNT_0053534383 /DNA_START=280 /DNA_END=963 /DNA_ORIENTATION=-